MNGAILRVAVAITIFEAGNSCVVAKKFPEWKVSPLGLIGVWVQAPLIVVGDVKRVRSIGTQTLDRLPWPATQNAHKLYWCEGIFSTAGAIRGRSPTTDKPYVWGSVQPGCNLSLADAVNDRRSVIRLWFLREEAGKLRPVVDGGADFFLELNGSTLGVTKITEEQQVATLLLIPGATNRSPQVYANEFFEYASLACIIMGSTQCIERIRETALRGDPAVKLAACNFLSSQYQQPCK